MIEGEVYYIMIFFSDNKMFKQPQGN